MRLAVVTSTGEVGGAEATDIHPLSELLRRGVELEVALPAEGPLRALLESAGARCTVVASPGALDGLSRRYAGGRLSQAPALALSALRYEKRLARWLRAVRPAAVLATGFRAQLAVTPLAAALRLPAGWIVADFIPAGPPACRLWSQLARVPRVVVTYSRASAAQPALARARDVRAVLSGIELERFPYGPEERADELLLVGHLTPLKNHLGFLEVVRAVRERRPQTRGTIAGGAIYRTGPHASYAESVAAEAAADPAVELVAAGPEEVAELMRRAAVLVHISTVPETFGRVCAEAMASGCVVVGFDRGATPEVLGDTGICVRAGDLAATAEACLGLLEDPERRAALARAARRRSESEFQAARAAREGADALELLRSA